MKKEVRGTAGKTKAETATKDSLALSSVEGACHANVAATAAPFASEPQVSPSSPKKAYSAEEMRVCSIEAMKNGETCEARQ